MKKRNFLFFFLCALLLTSLFSSDASAFRKKPKVSKKKTVTQTVQEKIFSRRALKTKIPIAGNHNFVGIGLYGEHEHWFNVPKNVELTTAPKIVYYLSHSETLSTESTVTVLVNDQPMQSLVLTPENAAKTKHEITIPLHVLRKGANEIKFRVYAIGQILHPCQELSNPANWIVIHKDSYLEASYVLEEVKNLKVFPQPFTSRGKMNRFPLAISLPQDPNKEELQAASVLVQYFGLMESFEYPKIEVFLGSKLPADAYLKYNIIAIGDLDRNVLREKLLAGPAGGDVGRLKVDNGLIASLESVSDSGHIILFITGPNSKVLPRTAEALTYEKIVQSMQGSHEIIDTTVPVEGMEGVKEKNNPSFLDLGYSTMKLTGIFENSVEIQYAPPPHWILKPGTAVVLDVTYSPLLNPNASILSVTINDRPIKSFKLKGAKNRVKYKIQIPYDMLDAKSFYITVGSALSIESGTKDESWCLNPQHDKAWVVIHDSSFVYTPHTFTDVRDFQTFPAVFLGEKGLDPVKLVLPENPTKIEYESAFNIIYAIASNMPYNVTPHFEILKTSAVTEDVLKDNNLVLLGRVTKEVPKDKQNPFIVEANVKLPLPIDIENGKPKKTRIEVLPQFLESVAVVELGTSPWNSKKYVLVVTSPDDYLIQKASEMFIDRSISAAWDGNITLVNSNGQWFSYAYGLKVKKRMASASKKYLIIWILSVIVLVGVIAGVWYWRKRHGFEDTI